MRVAFIGNIVGNAYIWSKFLREEGLAVDLFLRHKELGSMGPAWEDGRSGQAGLPDWIKTYEKRPPQARTTAGKWIEFLTSAFGGREAVGELETYDLIHSFTGSLFFSPLAIWRFGLRRSRPYRWGFAESAGYRSTCAEPTEISTRVHSAAPCRIPSTLSCISLTRCVVPRERSWSRAFIATWLP